MPLELSGSLFLSGSFLVSGSFGYTGSFTPSSGSLTFLPYLSGSFTTASVSTGSTNQPFLYVINGVLWYFDGMNWYQLYP